MTAAQHTPGPWKVYRNSSTRKLHAARQTAQGLQFLVTPSGHPREFKTDEAVRAAIAKAEGSAS